MFSRIARPTLSRARTARSYAPINARQYSVAATTFSSFPATLLRLNAGEAYGRFWHEPDPRSDYCGYPDDATKLKYRVEEAKKVWSDCLLTHTGTLAPNVASTQRYLRHIVDYYLEDVDNGVSVKRPFLFIIPKGTPLPPTLTLLREDTTRFSLRAHPSLLTNAHLDLNRAVEEFYSTYAKRQYAYEWLCNHRYEDAACEEDERTWMAT